MFRSGATLPAVSERLHRLCGEVRNGCSAGKCGSSFNCRRFGKGFYLKVTKLAPTRKMRMKFNKPIQLLAISAASLLVASLLSACATLTVDFVYVSSARAAGPNNYGEIDVFEINSQSGRMRQIVTSP